jgi:protein TonB
MSFVDQSRRPSPASMAAVVAIHAATGAALILGLTVTGTLPEVITKIKGINIEVPPPPPQDPVEDVKQTESAKQQIVAPLPPLDLNTRPTDVDVTLTPIIPPPLPTGLGAGIELPIAKPKPASDPVAARAKNDPGRWLTNSDYRPGWTRRELTGLASFRLDIAANGKVTGCSITRSTGHPELDEATCALVTKRARFEPARGPSGEPVAGSYNGSVSWELPD